MATGPIVAPADQPGRDLAYWRAMARPAQLEPDVHPAIVRALDRFRAEGGLERGDVRVLDFGCGFGRSVRALRRMGYTVHGVDIDADYLNTAGELLREDAIDPQPLLALLDARGRAPFADGSFDFVYTQEVLEHVRDLDTFLREVRRLTRPGGAGFHTFPAQLGIVESHALMPLIHWLPKNRMRKALIAAMMRAGVGQRPRAWAGLRFGERVERAYRYSVDETYYRPYRRIEVSFRRRGFEVEVTALWHPKLRRLGPLSRLLRVAPVARLADWAILTFFTVYVDVRLPA